MNLLLAPNLGEEVAVEKIESRLREFWSQSETSQKASLINLVIWSESEDALERLPEVIQAVSEDHACRALLIHAQLDPQLTPETKAWITAHCRLLERGKRVCSEQIAFDFRGRVTGRARNALMAHLLADLPVELYWEGEVSEFFQATLLRQVDRLVVDSALWKDAKQNWHLLEERREGLENLTLHDLSWTRSYATRLMLASRLDDQRFLNQLDQAQELEIIHAPEQRATALSILAWIATVQNLEFTQKTSQEGLLEIELSGANSFRAKLQEGESQSPAIQQINWQIGSSHLKLKAANEHGRVTIQHTNRMEHSQVISLEAEDCASLLRAQLGRGGRNTLFERCLPMIRELS